MPRFHFLLGLDGTTFIRFHFVVEAASREEAVIKANELIESTWGGLDAESFSDEYSGFCIYLGSQVRASIENIVQVSDLTNIHQAEMHRRSIQRHSSDRVA
jgi:hypothetical protein